MKLISVIMPAYNAELYISSAIESICHQTYRNFEFIIINDGSTDSTSALIHHYQTLDKRIYVITHKKNRGIVHSLNEGILRSKGDYIPRMDADDISLPQRLQEQVEFLEQHHEYGIVSSSFYVLRNDTLSRYISVFPHCDNLIKTFFLMSNPFPHGAVMIRRSIIENLFPSTYRSDEEYFEDYGLWSRLIRNSKFMILKEPLYIWRDNKYGISKRFEQNMTCGVKEINKRISPYVYNTFMCPMTPIKYFRLALNDSRKIFLFDNKTNDISIVPILKMYQNLFHFISKIFFQKKRWLDALFINIMSLILGFIYYIQKTSVILFHPSILTRRKNQ